MNDPIRLIQVLRDRVSTATAANAAANVEAREKLDAEICRVINEHFGGARLLDFNPPPWYKTVREISNPPIS